MKTSEVYRTKHSSEFKGGDYREHYKHNLEDALEFQDFVASLFYERGLPLVLYGSRKYQFERGENGGGVEIKLDKKFAASRNLYIETAEKSHPDNPHFAPSGIYRLDNTWLYAIGDYTRVFVFAKTLLQGLHRTGRYTPVEITTSQGFLLPEPDAIKYAATILTPKEEEK